MADPVSIGIQVAIVAASMAANALQKIEGPRLDSTKFTGGDYGAPLPLVWGKRRLEVPIFWAEELREIKRRGKTKGGKFNDYTYYGSWAVALAGHQINAVSRLWFDTHLVLDLTGAGPITPFELNPASRGGKSTLPFTGLITGLVIGNVGVIPAGGFALGDGFAFYPGSETQDPDPRMQATVEAEFGEGSCPAYRGTAYIVFKDVPLEKLGNRIPQVSVEMVSSPSTTYPTSTLTLTSETAWLTFAADYSSFLVGDYDQYTIVDTAARATMFEGTFDATVAPTNSGFGYLVDGTVLAIGTAGSNHVRAFPMDGPSYVYFDQTWDQTSVITLTDPEGNDHYLTTPLDAGYPFVFDGIEIDPADVSGSAWSAQWFLIDQDSALWAVGKSGSELSFYRLLGTGDGPGYLSVTMPGTSDPVRALHYADASEDHFVVAWDGDLYAIDRLTGAIVHSNTSLAYSGVMTAESFRAVPHQASTMWCGFEEINLADLSSVRVLTATSWGTSPSNAVTVYDPINHALITRTTNDVKWNYLDRVGSNGVPLSVIAGDIADEAGVVDHDFSALNQTVQGWSATQGQASNMLEPLLDAYDSDIRPHDFTLQGIKRSGVTGGTLLTERFVGEPRYAVTLRQGAELPRALIINFADVDADQQPNNARADRPLDATGARGEQTIDLGTLALDADEARDLADRYFRRLWNERKGVTLGLTAQQLGLEPGDVRTLTLDDETMLARLVRLDVKADGVLGTEWKYDHPSLAVLSGAAGAAFDGRDESVVVVPMLSKGFVLDIPYLSDIDDQSTPSVYVAASPYASGTWSGATIYQSVDGEYSDETATVASSSPATWGYATGVLGAPVSPWLWDRGSTVNVMPQVGSLTGTTEAAIDANPLLNLCLIGDELLNFTTATLQGDGSYNLSGFKRGRRGTEWACSTHAVRDVFLLLDTAEDVALGLSEVGENLSFKAITAGRTSAFPINLEPFTGASLKPYAPCHLEAVKEANGDWTLSWVRRTRVGGAWTSGTSIPLAEASEEYELDLSDGVDTVTKTVTSATTYTWTQAAQVADVGAEVMAGSLDWAVVQISDAVDRGFLAEATA